MPTKNFLLIASLSFTLLVTSRASAQDAPPAAAAPMPSPATGIATDSAATPDRLRGSLRLGPLMSGRIAPYGYTRSTTSVAPFLTTELEFLVLRLYFARRERWVDRSQLAGKRRPSALVDRLTHFRTWVRQRGNGPLKNRRIIRHGESLVTSAAPKKD